MIDKVFIALQSYNRYNMLVLMEQYLYDIWNEINIFDDGSTDRRIKETYGDLIKNNNAIHDLIPEAEANFRCGEQRKQIIDYFLEKSDKKYLMLLDDDIIITSETIRKGIKDFIELEKQGYRIGIYSFHTWMKDARRININGYLYGLFSLTGESCCLLSRRSLKFVGNNFGNSDDGYLDTHAKKMRERGFHLICRLNDPYQVQHIGIHNTSHIHKKSQKYWHKGLWRSYEGEHDYLRPQGFDPEKYMSIVNEFGAEKAPEEYLKYLEYFMDKKSNVRSNIAKIKGLPKLTILDARTREVIDIIDLKNTFVNSGYVKLLYLLADDSSGSPAASIEFGTNTATPAVTDTRSTISAAWDVKAISSSSINESNLSVTLTASLLSSEGNGFPISEVGLIAEDGTLLARTTFTVQNKSNNFIYVIDWTLQFTS